MAVRAPQAPLADRSSGSRRGTLMHIVERCEGTLGCPVAEGKTGIARRKAMAVEVAKLRNACAKNPRLFTAENLELSLEWCWKKRLRITSPVALVYHVEEALALAAVPEKPVDIIELRNEAVEFEKHHPDASSERWLRRLGRAQGAGLVSVIDEWKFARGR